MGLLSKNVLPDRGKEHKILYTLLSFFIPALVMTLGLVALRVVPFGDHSLAISDGKYYINGLVELKRILTGEDGVFYTFANGLGGNEWSILSWGGFNPVLLLVLFATPETMPAWFTWISVVNMALCGLTMYILLANVKGHKLSHLIFSTSYAMIGFSVINCFQTLFFLGPQILPLVALGLYRMLKGKSPVLYVVSLAFCIFFNFYFGFILLVASAVMILAFLYEGGDALKGKRLSVFCRWFVSSFIAGLLAAPMWLPALKAFSGGGRLDQTVLSEYSFKEKAPFIGIFSKLFSGSVTHSEMINGLPNIFCGILVVALVILFFANRSITSRRKRAAGVVLGFYLLTFFLPALTILMHGGTHTNWFPYRYSFVFSFFLIALAAEEFEHIDSVTPRDLKICAVAIPVSAVLVFSTVYEFVSGGAVVLDLLLLALMALGFRFYKTRPDKAPLRTFTMLLILIVSINLYANYIMSIQNMQKDEWELDLEAYNENMMNNGALIDALNLTEDSFFRMEKDVSESSSVGADPYLYGYNGVSHSGPAERAFVHKGLSRLGINRFDMRHWYSEGVTAATDTLLGLKYLVAERDLTEEKGYENRVSIGDTVLYQNKNALSAAILSNGEAAALEPGCDPFANLNDIFRAMTGEEKDVFVPEDDVKFSLHNAYSGASYTSAELKESSSVAEGSDESESEDDNNGKAAYIEYSFTAKRDGAVYYYDTSIPDSPDGLSTPSSKYVGYFRKGEEYTGKINLPTTYSTDDFLRGYCVNLSFAYADGEALSELAEVLNARDITFEVSDCETRLSGSFTAEEGQVILFTIPWDEGWTCFIDGQKVEIDKTWDLFMSVEVPAGEHTYEMKFVPAWMNYGLCAGAVALVAFIVMIVAYEIGKRKKKTASLDAAVAVEESPEAGGEAPAAEDDPETVAPEERAPEQTEDVKTEERS